MNSRVTLVVVSPSSVHLNRRKNGYFHDNMKMEVLRKMALKSVAGV